MMEMDCLTLALGAVLCVVVTFIVDMAMLWMLFYLTDADKDKDKDHVM